MENKNEKIEILKFLSQTHRAQFDRRREYEWKTLFSTLGVFGLSAATKLTGRVDIPDSCGFKILVWVIFIFLAVISSVYLYNIHIANQINKHFAEIAEGALIRISNFPDLVKAQSKAEKSRSPNFWSITWQLVTILSFALAAAYVVTL